MTDHQDKPKQLLAHTKLKREIKFDRYYSMNLYSINNKMRRIVLACRNTFGRNFLLVNLL